MPTTTGRRRRRGWLVLIVVVVAAALAGEQLWRSAHAAPAVRYLTTPVTLGSVTRSVTASGSVSPENTIQVGTYVSGVIEKLSCDFNTRVRKGQLCAQIDPRPYQSLVDQSRASVGTATAQLAKDETSLAYARLTFDRTADLRSRGIVSQDAYDAAKNALDQAQSEVALDRATLDQRQAALDAASINLAYTHIVSPVDGTVVSRNVTVGQTVAASFQTPTLFLIATDLTKMQVDANVSESDIGGVTVGNRATFTVEAFPNQVFDGQVTQVRQAPQTVQNVVTYDVVVSVANPELLLKPGMTATIRIVVDQRTDVLCVSDHALRYRPGLVTADAAEAARSPGRARVWVLRDGRPEEVSITTGLDDDSVSEIVAGELHVGDAVITGEVREKTAMTSATTRLFRL